MSTHVRDVSRRFVAEEPAFAAVSDAVSLRTETHRQFVDLTELVAERVRRARVRDGLVSVRSLHTTAAVVVNEHEPLLLEDFARLLDRLSPDGAYAHDDLPRRRAVPPDERPNGASHCRALLLGDGVTLHVADGTLQLGPWQRVLLVELDGPRRRVVSIVVMGQRGSRG